MKTMTEPMSGQELHYILKEYGIRQHELAEVVGRSQPTISRLFELEKIEDQYITALERLCSGKLPSLRERYKQEFNKG